MDTFFFFSFFFVFNKRSFRDFEARVDKMLRTEFAPRFQRGFCGLIFRPLVQGTDSGEENNPATVRWIDTTRTYVDMWGCTRLITPEASWDAERLKRPYPSSSVLSGSPPSTLCSHPLPRSPVRFSAGWYRAVSLGRWALLTRECLQPTLHTPDVSHLRAEISKLARR